MTEPRTPFPGPVSVSDGMVLVIRHPTHETRFRLSEADFYITSQWPDALRGIGGTVFASPTAMEYSIAGSGVIAATYILVTKRARIRQALADLWKAVRS